MSSLQYWREFVKERLTAAAEEIVGVFEFLRKLSSRTKKSSSVSADCCMFGNLKSRSSSASAADIESTLTLPSTPRLILTGEVMKPRAWMLSIEGQVVMGPHADFVHGIAALFASYYNFNLQYPKEAACTLEFIQRCFVGINPEKGSKAKKQRGSMTPPVCTLMRKLMDLE